MPGFFHTLVVFGAGASLAGCGAKISDQGGGHEGPHGGSESVGGGISLGGAVAPSAGGAPSLGGAPGNGGRPMAGGAPGTGGTLGIGGTAPVGGAAGAGGINPAQLTCDGRWEGCAHATMDAGYVSFYLPSGSCTVDPTRPQSEADCPATQRFECARASLGEKLVGVECHCVPTPSDGSCDDCTYQGSGRLQTGTPVCSGRTKLCGCYTGILVK